MVEKTINEEEFDYILKKKKFLAEKNPHVALCVSGGPDSLALLVLMNQWLKKEKGCSTVIHFNHNLRKESKQEEQFVRKFCKKLGVALKVLSWNGTKPKTSLMKKSRDERYKQIIDYCANKEIITIMTAHHLDDCLETYLMRKLRGYATLGLNSIPMQNIQEKLQIFRPFIDIKKERLINTCKIHKLNWINDSSNSDNTYERVRIRKHINGLGKEKYKTLLTEYKKSLVANFKIEKKLDNFLIKNLSFFNYGKFSLDKEKLLKSSENMQVEILKKILVTCSGNIYPPKNLSLKNLIRKIRFNQKFKFSINWCIVNVKDESVEFYREYEKIKRFSSVKKYIKKSSTLLWDNRFFIKTPKNDLTCEIMTEQKWLKIKKRYKNFYKNRNVYFEIIKTLPLIKFKNIDAIPFVLNHDELLRNSIMVSFHPKIPLTKKNF